MQQTAIPAARIDGQISLPRSSQAGSRARTFIHARFGDHLGSDAFDNAQMVVSEMVNNAVIHGAGAIQLKAQLGQSGLRVEVVDEGAGKALAIRTRRDDEGGGWGLLIVESLSTRWGAFEGTTHVWAELPAD